MTEPHESQSLSAEVVGNYSEKQKQEYTVLGNGVLSALSLKADNPEDVEVVRAFLDDFINRGLKQQQKLWFRNDEPIAGIFQAGFAERKQVVVAMKQLASNLDFSDVVSHEEENEATTMARSLTPFSHEVKIAENTLDLYKKRRKTIEDANKLLFEGPNIKQTAGKLRDDALLSNARLTPREINKMLYRNLLLNFVLYGTPGIEIEPKDVAALSDLWNSDQVKQDGMERVRQQMQKIAHRGNLDSHVIDIYTQNLLVDFLKYTEKLPNEDGESKKLELTSLQHDEIFIVTREALRLEAVELAKPVEVKEAIIDKDEIGIAHQKYEQGIKLFDEAEQVLEEAGDEDVAENTFEAFEKHMASLSPYEMLQFLYDLKSSNKSWISELQLSDSIPLEADLEVLKLVSNLDTLKVKQTGEPVFKDADPRILTEIKIRGVDVITTAVREGELPLQKALQVSLEFTLNIIDKLSVIKPIADELKDQPVEWWADLLKSTGVEYRDIRDGGTVKGMEIDEPRLADFVRLMPDEKQNSIADAIRTIVTL